MILKIKASTLVKILYILWLQIDFETGLIGS